MNTLIQSFAGGTSFAAGAFIGAMVIATLMRRYQNKNAKELIEGQKSIDLRLYDQVEVLRRIANALEDHKK